MTDRQSNIKQLSKESVRRIKAESENLIVSKDTAAANAELLRVQSRLAQITKDKSQQ